MKTAVFAFRDVRVPLESSALKKLISLLNGTGISVDRISLFSSTDEKAFILEFERIKDVTDNLFILDNEKLPVNVKELIAESLNLSLTENDNAKKFIDAYNVNYNKNATPEYALLPEGSTVIPNFKGAFQGYMIENDYLLTVLPDNEEQISMMCIRFVLPYFETKYGIKKEILTLKMFGVNSDKLSGAIIKAEKFSEGKLNFYTESKNGDTSLNIIYDNTTPKMTVDSVVRTFALDFGDKLYAEDNYALAERLVDLLKLKKVKFSTAESFTAGRIASDIIKISGASEVLEEGVVAYSNEAKITRLGVRKETLDKFGAVSKETAYEMCAGLLKNGRCDFAVATTGIAGPNSDNTNKPVGLAYISVGSKEGIHVHKINFTGDREEITETAKNNALFLAIKLLKNT